MEILNELPEELYFNVIKYLKHPLAHMIKNYYITEPWTWRPCLEYLKLRRETDDYDVVRCCDVCFHEMERSPGHEYEYKFGPIYYCEYCEDIDYDED